MLSRVPDILDENDERLDAKESGTPERGDESTLRREQNMAAMRVAGARASLMLAYHHLFNSAPLPLHSINREGKLVKVNERWIEEFGYRRDEVLGRPSIEFLSEESRDRAVHMTLPQFWRDGSIRGVGYRFLRKSGEPFVVLLDADLHRSAEDSPVTIAALRDSTDPTLASLASGLLRTLRQLRSFSDSLQDQTGGASSEMPAGAASSAPQPGLDDGLLTEALAALLEDSHDSVHDLRAEVEALREWSDLSSEQHEELSGLLKEVQRYLPQVAKAG